MRITPDYRREQYELHQRPGGYGGKGDRHADGVHQLAWLISSSGIRVEGILDYGCGQGALQRELGSRGLKVTNYDPALPKWAGDVMPHDIVVCTDVLEHVEPECIEEVFNHLRGLTQVALYVVIALEPAGKWLSDGRNAHILLRPAGWWMQQLGTWFNPAPSRWLRALPMLSEKHYASVWSAK